MRVVKFFSLLCVLFLSAASVAVAAQYNLVVAGGTGSGVYASGTDVTIVAAAPAAGKVFDKWTGDTSYISNPSASTTQITVPEKNVVVFASYKDIVVNVARYTLTVNSGTGSGVYAVGTDVNISANNPPVGKVFDQWTGNIGLVHDFYSSSTKITIPEGNVNVTALYKDISNYKYTLTVNNGTGSGNYAVGNVVNITAKSPAAGKVFDQWTGDVGFVYDFYASSTKVTIPESNINLTATYKDSGAILYTLSVNNGTGSGTYYSGEKVTVKANTPAAGKVFDRWTGDVDCISSATSSTITVTIPAHGISLTATYKIPTPTPAPAPGYAEGTLIKIAASTKVYVIMSGKKKWIPTPEVFEQLGYNWTAIKVLSDAELSKIPDFEDNLIRQSGDAKVFLVVNGIKRHIPNPDIFLNYGFDWKDVKDVDKSVVDKYRTAFLIRVSKEANVYYLVSGVRKLIPTLEIFNSYGNKSEDVQVISRLEMDSYILTNLVRLSGSTDIYLIRGDTKLKIMNAAVFERYNFNWNHVIDINQTELNYYRDEGYLR